MCHQLPEDPLAGGKIPLDLDGTRFSLRYKDWKKGSFVEKRLVIQRLLCKLIGEGWQDPTPTHEELISDFRKIIDYPPSRCFLKQTLRDSARYGKKIICGFYPIGDLDERRLMDLWERQLPLYRGIRRILLSRHTVNRHNLIFRVRSLYLTYKTSLKSPNFYRALFRQFGMKGVTVANPDSLCGLRAIAATLEGCTFYSDDPYLGKLSAFLGTEFFRLSDCSHFDYVLFDRWSDCSAELENWKRRADNIVVFVPVKHKDKYPMPTGRVEVCHRETVGWYYHYSI